MKNTKLRNLVKPINVKKVVAEKLREMGIECEGIENYAEIEDYSTLIANKKLIIDPERITQAVLNVDIKGRSRYSVIEKAEGNQVTNFSRFGSLAVKTENGLEVINEKSGIKATDTFQQLVFSANAISDGTLAEIVNYGYYSNTKKGEAYIVRPGSKEGVVRVKSLCSGDGNYIAYKKEDAEELLKDCSKYAFFTSTNAEMKHSASSAVNVAHHDPEELLDKLSFGAYHKAKAKYANKTVKMVDLAKALPRFGQQKSPSGKVEPCLNEFGYLILKKPMNMLEFKEFDYEGKPLPKDFEGYNIIDGSCFSREDYDAVTLSIKLIQKGLKVVVNPKAVRGLQTQFRIWTFKGTKLAKKPAYFQRLIENIEDTMTEDEDYVIVGNRDNIVNIMDSDTVKTVFGVFPDFEKHLDAKLFIMALSNPTIIDTSKYQMLNKPVGCDNVNFEKLKGYIIKKALETITKDFKPVLESTNKTQSMVRLDTINTGFVNDILIDMTNGRVLQRDLSLATKFLRNMDNTIKNQVGGIRLDLNGESTYGMLCHDTTAMAVRPKYRKACFGEDQFGILGYKEVYSKDWNEKVVAPYKAKRMDEARKTVETFYMILDEETAKEKEKAFLRETREDIKKEIKQGTAFSDMCLMVKFPAPGLNEVYKARLLSSFEIKERAHDIAVKLHAIDPKVNIEKEARLLADSILDTTPGTIVMPALEPLKNFLAGFDDDGDAAALVWQKELVEFFLKVKDIMVEIDTNDMGNSKTTVNNDRVRTNAQKNNTDSIYDKIRNATF